MKAISFLPLAILGVVADPTLQEPPTLVGRDLATVTSVVASVQSALTTLDTAVKGFSSDATQVTSASSALLTTLKDGTAKVSASAALSLTDALGLQSVVQGLQTVGNSLVTDLQAKKAQFQQASLCTVVFQTTGDIGTASKALIDAIVSKVPTAAQGVAGQLASGLTATLDQGKAAFAPGNCTNASGGSGAGTGAGAGGGATVSTTAKASATVPVPVPTGGGVVTVTVTAQCGAATTVTSTSLRTTAVVTTARNTTIAATATPTKPPVVTAAAALNSVGNAGAILAVLAAAIAL